jgi:ribonuclease J
VLFPEDSQPGVDLILPDFEDIRERLDTLEAIVLTHAHEDHIGAVPYLLREAPQVPVLGSRLTLALLEAKLREHRIKATTIEVSEGDTVRHGPFGLEFVAVNHSIPDALAVYIDTAAGTVLHTGDFKMDQLPLDGRITDLRSFARLGERGVDLFLVDSTNAEVPGFVRSEREIEPAIDRTFSSASGRIVVASFASHIHRIQQIIDIARRHNRRVAFFGRSMVRNMGVARELGYLELPDGMLVTAEQLAELPDDQVVLVCTGSQGEPMAALSRIANNDHQIKVGPGDTVILASSLIPGNENAVGRVINGLTRLGAKVVHKGNAMVHVSGHAAAGELLYCYNIVRPRNVMPVHGEPRHLKANAELAVQTGVPPERVMLTLDGGVVDLVAGRATVTGAVPCGYVYVDGASVGDLTESSLKDRRVLGSEGFITCFVVVDSVDGKVTAGPEIHARGFIEDDSAFDAVLPRIKQAVEDALREGTSDEYALAQIVRRVLGRWVNDQHRRRPMILPVVVEA